MYFLGLGLVLMALKYLEIGPVAKLEWWQVLIPFALAAVWWGIADATGYTKKKAVELMGRKQAARLQAARDNINPGLKKRR
ncbi:MAG: TIGR04438 family Trp-rich protein [Betaproteobacteria bacterium]|nr:TIGR04438 family Trp-rich protein [Betaproteobacteria bacterium]